MRFGRTGSGGRAGNVALLGGCVCVLVLGLALIGGLDHRTVHFALSKSEPGADATVSPPEELRLWFTQAPQSNSMSIRLMAGDAVAETGSPTPDSEDDKMYSVRVMQTLEAGSHRITWRAMAADGHVVRGEIPFTVQVP